MKRNNRGISLIVLVITVIVMIILAGSVIISLSNSGIIGKANEAVDANNLKQVEQLAALAWSEAYIDRLTDKTIDLEARVEEALIKNKVDTEKYIVNVTDNGVNVAIKSTLGELIKEPTVDYGKIVDYEAKGVKEWQVFYEDEINGYVFLIAKDKVEDETLEEGIEVSSLTSSQTNIYNIFRLGKTDYTLSDTYHNNPHVAYIIANYSSYANTLDYGSNVIGAIGGPTLELLAAGYNDKYPDSTTKLAAIVDISYKDYEGYESNGYYEYDGAYGYFVNTKGNKSVSNLIKDDIYITTKYLYWLSTPSANENYDGCAYILAAGLGYVQNMSASYNSNGIRPVVCLKSSIPAIANGDTGYSLIKSEQ